MTNPHPLGDDGVKMKDELARAEDARSAHATAAKGAGLRAAECLPCPICKGVEGCDHTVPERAGAWALKREEDAEKIARQYVEREMMANARGTISPDWNAANLAAAYLPLLDEVRERRAVPSPKAEWRSMESAPKDGTCILLGYNRRRPLVGYAYENVYGWYSSEDDGLVAMPERWQPLPSPPVAEGE